MCWFNLWGLLLRHTRKTDAEDSKQSSIAGHDICTMSQRKDDGGGSSVLKDSSDTMAAAEEGKNQSQMAGHDMCMS